MFKSAEIVQFYFWTLSTAKDTNIMRKNSIPILIYGINF